MDDKELADKVVALGVGDIVTHWNGCDYTLDTYDNSTTAGQFVRDWRVAGALMEKCESVDTWWNRDHKEWCAEAWLVTMDSAIRKQNESLPRAIIEACVEALASEEE